MLSASTLRNKDPVPVLLQGPSDMFTDVMFNVMVSRKSAPLKYYFTSTMYHELMCQGRQTGCVTLSFDADERKAADQTPDLC